MLPSEIDQALNDGKHPNNIYQIKISITASKTFVFDVAKQCIFLKHSQDKYELGYAHSRILQLLIECADEIVTREAIHSFAWPGRVVTTNSLNQAIYKLRDFLCDDEERIIIQTISRRGYRFNAKFLILHNSEIEYSDNTKNDTKGSQPQNTIERQNILTPLIKKNNNLHFLFSSVITPTNCLWLLILLLMALLVLKIDWSLLQPGYQLETKKVNNKLIHYIASDQIEMNRLKIDTDDMVNRLTKIPSSHGELILNRMFSFFDIICLNNTGTPKFITVHQTRSAELTDEQLQACLK